MMWKNEDRILFIITIISIIFDILFMILVLVQVFYLISALSMKAAVSYFILKKKYKIISYFIFLLAMVISALANAKAIFIEANNLDYVIAYSWSNTALCLAITILLCIKFISQLLTKKLE